MKLSSPLPIDECRAALREQVTRRSVFTRMRLFRASTSHVTGEIEDEKVVLESSIDLFSKRFVGALRSSPEGSVLEGCWEYPFGSRFWGDEKFDEEEVFRFLADYARFSKPTEPAATAQRGQPSVFGRFTRSRNSVLGRPAWLIFGR